MSNFHDFFKGSSASCVQGSQNGNALTNKYCGQKLNPVKESETDVAICGKKIFSFQFRKSRI